MLDEIIHPAVLSTFETVFRRDTLPGVLSGLSLRSYIRHITGSFDRLGDIFVTVCPDNYKARRESWYLASAAAPKSCISTQPHFSLIGLLIKTSFLLDKRTCQAARR